MYRIVIFLLLVSPAYAAIKPTFSFSNQEDAIAWSEEVLKLEKQYKSDDKEQALKAREQVARLSREWREYFKVKWPTKQVSTLFRQFTENLWYVGRKNVLLARKKEPWWVSQGKFADLSFEQFKRKYLPEELKYPRRNLNIKDLKIRLFKCFDWRKKDVVTDVRNQGACGSCWAFASVATIESRYLISKGETVSKNPINLSEQQLVDCVRSPRRDLAGDPYNSAGCSGGWSNEAMEYVRQHNVTYESVYPYTASNGRCRQNVGRSAVTLSGPNPGWSYYSGGNATLIKSLIAVSPVVNYLRVESGFQLYNGGVLTTPCVNQGVNHATAIVGYCTSRLLFGNFNYWIVKNSWGDTWGENGFYKIPILSNSPGLCQSQANIFQPTVPVDA